MKDLIFDLVQLKKRKTIIIAVIIFGVYAPQENIDGIHKFMNEVRARPTNVLNMRKEETNR